MKKEFSGAAAVSEMLDYAVEFSFCSLVSNSLQYQELLDSFRVAGFAGDCCEYLYIDNTDANSGDGYTGLNRLANQARGRFVIFCHQDLLAMDGPDRMREIIADMDRRDPNWAVLSNAGARGKKRFLYLTENGVVLAGDKRHDPKRVDSVDENFILMRSDARLGFSNDLEGYHLYGTDLVTQARLRGFNAYAVDFRLEHLGRGAIDQKFRDSCEAFEKKYADSLEARSILTTCTQLDLGVSKGNASERRKLAEERGPEFVRSSKLVMKKIRTFANKNRIEVDGIRFGHPDDVPYAAYHALRKGFYELPKRNMIKSYLPTDLPVVELGGSYGIISGLINERLDTGVRQIVVEANPKLLDLCRENALRTKADRKLTIVHCAIDYSGADKVSFNVTSGTHDSHVLTDWRADAAENTVQTPSKSLNGLLASEGVDGPYSLVCDIEGAEFDLLAKDAVGLEQCQLAVIELNPSVFYERGESVTAFLNNLDVAGFEVLESEATVIVARKK